MSILVFGVATPFGLVGRYNVSEEHIVYHITQENNIDIFTTVRTSKSHLGPDYFEETTVRL
jgi:hypothetical protein